MQGGERAEPQRPDLPQAGDEQTVPMVGHVRVRVFRFGPERVLLKPRQQFVIESQTSKRVLRRMDVQVVETGNDQMPRTVDHFGIRVFARQRARNAHHLAALDQHIAVFDGLETIRRRSVDHVTFVCDYHVDSMGKVVNGSCTRREPRRPCHQRTRRPSLSSSALSAHREGNTPCTAGREAHPTAASAHLRPYEKKRRRSVS